MILYFVRVKQPALNIPTGRRDVSQASDPLSIVIVPRRSIKYCTCSACNIVRWKWFTILYLLAGSIDGDWYDAVSTCSAVLYDGEIYSYCNTEIVTIL